MTLLVSTTISKFTCLQLYIDGGTLHCYHYRQDLAGHSAKYPSVHSTGQIQALDLFGLPLHGLQVCDRVKQACKKVGGTHTKMLDNYDMNVI